MAKKQDFFRYQRYSADPQARGNVAEWGSAFRTRMGVEEAKTVLGADTPLGLLGLSAMPTLAGLKAAYRKLILKFHPDNKETGNADHCLKVIAAYTMLEQQLNP